MKKLFLLFLFTPFCCLLSQETQDLPDVEAKFAGGSEALQKYMSDNLVYPQKSVQTKEQGKVYVSFFVEKAGSITGVNVERGVSKNIDEEAVRLIKNMPKWIPAELAGQKARTRFVFPINFTLVKKIDQE